MRNNKWIKWVVGVGSVSTVAVIFSFLQTDNKEADQLASPLPIYKGDVGETNISTLKKEERVNREAWISSLDWKEANWEVDESASGVIVSPRQSAEGMPPAESRTRRS